VAHIQRYVTSVYSNNSQVKFIYGGSTMTRSWGDYYILMSFYCLLVAILSSSLLGRLIADSLYVCYRVESAAKYQQTNRHDHGLQHL